MWCSTSIVFGTKLRADMDKSVCAVYPRNSRTFALHWHKHELRATLIILMTALIDTEYEIPAPLVGAMIVTNVAREMAGAL